MNKTPSLFLRDFTLPGNPLTREINPEAQWVFDGEGIATRKYDGACVMLDDQGRWWARREVKKGKDAPPNWRPVEHDDFTGKQMGWEPIEQSPWAKFLREAVAIHLEADGHPMATPGTYELIGPKVNGNPEREAHHRLIRHAAAEVFPMVPSDLDTYETIRIIVRGLHAEAGWEGIVWHHPDGRMAKIKATDFAHEA